MGSNGGSTTVPLASVRGAFGTQQGDRALVWLFPRPGDSPVSLSFAASDEVIIGRDEACTVHLPGGDISRQHAALRPSGEGARRVPEIFDLASRNGTRVNGTLVSSAKLSPGDVVRLGGCIGVVTTAPGGFQEIAPGLLGGGVLQAALHPLRLAATSDLPIVLEGETGTGKEVVTRAVHLWSGRKGPLVAVNCAALPEALAEGELFGYRRGAFTGADRASAGFFRNAHGGTLLLDEVSDLPLALQAKLLRVLEEREVQPLGEARPVPIDVRVIVAGQQSLMTAVQEGRFRADLLARLDGVTVRVPPLRHRREDVLPLFGHWLRELSPERTPAMDPEFVERLCLHDWPFNVRELVLLVRRLLVLHGSEPTLHANHLSERIANGPSAVSKARAPLPNAEGRSSFAAAATGGSASSPLEPVDLPTLVVALRASSGNVARASAMLGITRQRAYRLMEGQGVDLESLRMPGEAEEPLR